MPLINYDLFFLIINFKTTALNLRVFSTEARHPDLCGMTYPDQE